MAESSVTAWKARYLTSVKDGLQRIAGLGRSYPRLRPLQIRSEEHQTIPHSGTLLEEIEVSKTTGRYSPSSIQDLYVPDQSGFVPRNLVLVGPHGVGKTSTLQKILLDWASGKLFTDKFDFVFFVSGREINQISGVINLARLLSRACRIDCPEDVTKAIFSDPSKVLLLIDGFDELKWTLEDDYEDYEDPFQDTHRDTFLRCLFDKDILEETSLIITSSSQALSKMKQHVQRPSFLELLGFSQEEMEQYLHGLFSDKDQAEQAISVLKANEILHSLCAVPLTCQLFCTILKAGMKKDLGPTCCKTLTCVYLLYLQSLLKSHSQSAAACLKNLCALANDGVFTQKALFQEEDLQKHSLTISEVDSVFPKASLFQQDMEVPSSYSFTHLSLQEFCAALYYVLGQEAEDKETGGAKGDAFLPRICTGKSLDLVENRPYLIASVRFLFGLLNNQHLKAFASSIGCHVSLKAKGAMGSWIVDKNQSRIFSATLSFLYEAQDAELCNRVFNTDDLALEQGFYSGAKENIPTKEILCCLKSGKKSLSLEDYLIRPKDLDALAPIFHSFSKVSFVRCGFADLEAPGKSSWLSNAKSNINELDIQVCVVTPTFFQDLSSLLYTSRSLTKLILAHHNLEDSTMKVLCDGLRNPGCFLKELTLDDCNLTPSSCQELGSALKGNRSLQKLDLSLNKLEDAGVKALCEGLKDPACTVQELRMDFCEVTPGCCEDLRSLLQSSRSLTTLYMRDNDLQDAGAKLLCEGLLHPGCPLKELRLHESHITSTSCPEFRSVLLANHTLTTLDLTYNNLGDSGVKVLCEGLQDPACTLQELVLQHCDLSPAACPDLATTIQANRSLTKLDLTWNNLQDSGVTDLCRALKSPNCTLQELRLFGCDLTSCQDLASVMTATRSLTKLDLCGNQFGDTATQAVCEALRSPGCPLQEFRVGYCNMTESCAKEVQSAISTNHTLQEMEVTFGFEDVEPPADLDALCRKFQFPGCTVQKNETQDGTFIYFTYKKQK